MLFVDLSFPLLLSLQTSIQQKRCLLCSLRGEGRVCGLTSSIYLFIHLLKFFFFHVSTSGRKGTMWQKEVALALLKSSSAFLVMCAEYTRAVACTNASSSSSLLISTALLSIPFHLQHFSWSFTGRGATTRRRFSFSFFFLSSGEKCTEGEV